ncbi:hypothetical protein B5M10_04635 [Pluralibacter gergoviae]|uniref:DUF2756 domain-containing protein n=1 Tax=Pluralibacter gergoviae TaxID=61647 RepID=UPI0005ED1FA7|nr:DUF2756 domain-containing protein [Pluralibacter gergoviae]KJM61992.1 membrane protein [Pluralibacter gergoviae]OUR03903.1 hypothetical protein B5M10_04635 [Pluralibacter gergoviae]
MKKLLWLAALVPFVTLAQPLNPTNTPNQPGYQIRSQQRLQNEMQTRQIQQQSNLNQQLQNQSRQQRLEMRTQLDNQQQSIQRAQPGGQMLPNNSGSMLNSRPQNGDMLRSSSSSSRY